MESQAPEFSDYVHAIGRRKALMIGVAIPIAVLAVLLSLTLPDIYTSSAQVEIDEKSGAQDLANEHEHNTYADQYVQNLKGIVLTESNLMINPSEVLLVGIRQPALDAALQDLVRPDQYLIDLVNLPNRDLLRCHYEGICW